MAQSAAAQDPNTDPSAVTVIGNDSHARRCINGVSQGDTSDTVLAECARGLTNHAINFGHALKNTLVPVITVFGLQLGSLIAFAVVTETVFAWPGVGQLFIQSVQFSDIPVMAAYLLLIGLLFVVINLTVDLLYSAVDPRLRHAGNAKAAGH